MDFVVFITVLTCFSLPYYETSKMTAFGMAKNKKHSGEILSSHEDVTLENCVLRCTMHGDCEGANIGELLNGNYQCELLGGSSLGWDTLEEEPHWTFLYDRATHQAPPPAVSPPIGAHETCKSLSESGISTDGVYTIYPSDGLGQLEVFCELDPVPHDGSTSAGWIVIQRRVDATVDFDRDWDTYEDGFGDLTGNLWLGLRQIYRLTARAPMELQIFFEEFNGTWSFAQYNSFQISRATDHYRLNVSEFSGSSTASDSLAYHNGKNFHTFDNHHNSYCAGHYGAGWWYGPSYCYTANLNGNYRSPPEDLLSWAGIIWVPGLLDRAPSKKTVIMKIR